MNIAYIDKELYDLENFRYLSGDITEIDRVECFQNEEKFIDYIRFNNVKLVFMDLDWDLIKRVQEIDEKIAISIITSDKKQALTAYEQGMFGYILKPYTSDDIKKITLRLQNIVGKRDVKDVKIKTFGRFDIFVDGRALFFSNKKAKELLALLVDHRGGIVTMDETIDILWEERLPDEKTKALYRMATKNLRDTLRKAGCDDILIESRGQRSIDFRRIDCDYYNFFEKPQKYRHLFNGEYMTEYSWGEYTLAKLLVKFNAEKICLCPI